MNKQNQIYKCELCGQIVEVIIGGTKLKCCGSNMALLEENTVDAAVEKHVPVVEKTATGIKVKVGEIAHPMADEHYIQWIEVIAGNLVYRKQLKPGETPVAEFLIDAENVSARAYCNLHGLWKV